MNVAVFFILFAVIVGVALDLRERAVARRAGMSRTRPVCAACFYRLGGWTSPVCPECGTDVRTSGVRIGPRSSRIVIGAGVILASVVFVGPIAAYAFTYLFAESNQEAFARIEAAHIDRLNVTIESDSRWRRFPPRDEHESAIVLTQLVPDVVAGQWTNGRYAGRQLGAERILAYDEQSDVPTRSMIQAAIREVVVKEIDETVITKLAAAIERLVIIVRDDQSRGGRFMQSIQGYTDQAFKPIGNRGGGSFSGGGMLSAIATLVSIIGAVVFGLRAAFRRCRPGWRPPREDEWANVEDAG